MQGAIAVSAFAAAGELYPAFGFDGRVTAGADAYASATAIEGDGRIVVAGGRASGGFDHEGRRFALACYLP